jgi:hypothetical protein
VIVIGCYKDAADRAMNGATFNDAVGMTLTKCRNYCLEKVMKTWYFEATVSFQFHSYCFAEQLLK